MNHSWAPALDGYAGIEASPDSIRARNLRARNSRAARPCSSLWSTSSIHSHIIGHRTLDDIEACQQSGGRSGSADADGPALFRNEALRSIVCALGQTPQSRRALTRLIPPGTPRWGAAWKKATVDNCLSAISGATRLFEEPGALDVVAQLARDWFERHLISGRMRHRGELQIEAWELLVAEPLGDIAKGRFRVIVVDVV